MILELCGLPGVGKSTLYKQLIKSERFESVNIKNKGKIIKNFFLFSIRYKKYTTYSILYALKYRKNPVAFWNTCVVRLASYNIANKRSDKIVILEEGPLQNIFSYAEALQDKKRFEKYLSLVPLSDKVIFLNLSEEVRQERLVKRGLKREKENLFLEEGDIFMQTIKEHLLGSASQVDRYQVFASGEEAFNYLNVYEKIS